MRTSLRTLFGGFSRRRSLVILAGLALCAAIAGQAVLVEEIANKGDSQSYVRAIDGLGPLDQGTSSTPSYEYVEIAGRRFWTDSLPLSAGNAAWLASGAEGVQPIGLEGISQRVALLDDAAYVMRLPRAETWPVSMEGIRFPVDAVFVSNSGRVGAVLTMQPGPVGATGRRVIHEPETPGASILFLRGGRAAELAVEKGTRLPFLATAADPDAEGATSSAGDADVYVAGAIKKMIGSKGYTATGIATIEDSTAVKEVRERYSYYNPNMIGSRYATTVRNKGNVPASNLIGTVACPELEAYVLLNLSLSRCVAGARTPFSRAELKSSPTDNLSFRPWLRFLMCESVDEIEPRNIDGMRSRGFSCLVPRKAEASIIWDTPQKQTADVVSMNQFLLGGAAQVTVYIREKDGYIARFELERVRPYGLDSVRETVAYNYADFNKTTPVKLPRE